MSGGSSAEQGGSPVGADPACGLGGLLAQVPPHLDGRDVYRIWLVDAGGSREVEV